MLRKLLYLSIVVLIGVLLWKYVWNKPAPPENVVPEGKVSGQTLASARFPGVKLQVTPEFQYLGAQRFQLNEASDVEQHIWVETDETKNIQRAIWIQYEAYLPHNNFTFDHDGQPMKVEHGGLQWKCNMMMLGARREGEAESLTDGARFRRFLRAKAVKLPEQYLQFRCFHLSSDAREDFMIIFLEDLELTEFAQKPRPLGPDKKIVRPASRAEVREAITKRLKERIQISK